MQIIALIGQITDEPKECIRNGRRVIIFHVVAENSPLGDDCTTAEFEVITGRWPDRDVLREGSEVFAYGLLRLEQGLMPYALVTAVAVKVVGLDDESKTELIMDFLTDGVYTDIL